MQEADDNVLLREYAERGSEEAFASLVTRHINKVYSVALRHTGSPHSAEEITQAVFVILASKAPRLHKNVILSGWLYQTTRLASLTFIRGEIRRARREQEAHMQAAIDENESEVWTQIAPLLDAAMAGLNETDRHAIVLRFFDCKSMKQVGVDLGASEDAAKMRVNRALEKLRLFFTRRGVTAPAAVLAAAISANSIQAAPSALVKAATAIARTRGAVVHSSTSSLAKGVLKVMAYKKATLTVICIAAVLLIGGTTTVVIVESQSGHGPLGRLMEKKRQKDALIKQMDSMIPVHGVIWAFAHAHQDELPKDIVQLQQYLPTDIVEFDDGHWEMVASGKITTELVKQNGILLQQKNVPPGKAKIVIYMDGAMAYQK